MSTGLSDLPSTFRSHLGDAAIGMAGGQSQGTEVARFVDILKARLKDVERGFEWARGCEDLLKEINQSLNPNVASGQELLEIAGDCDLLEVAVQYAGISESCEASINTLIANIAGTCDPRVMFTVFFEVINMYTKPPTLHLCIPLLHGLSIVFRRIRRRHAEFFKEAIPGLLEVGTTALEVKLDGMESEMEDEISESRYRHIPHYFVLDNVPSKLVDKLVNLGNVMTELCSHVGSAHSTQDSEENQRLHDVSVLYNLRLMALVSCTNSAFEGAIPEAVEDIIKLMVGSNFYVREILTTGQLEEILHRYADDDEGQVCRTRFEARIGAALSVYWGIHRRDSPTATLVSDLLKSQNETSGRRGVSYLINMASILLVPVGWKQDLCFQQKGLTLITSIVEVFKTMPSTIDAVQHGDASVHIMPALRRIQDVIVRTADSSLRKDAYALLIKTIRQFLPAPERYQALYDMITNCDHPSMVSLLLTCVKDEVASAWPELRGGSLSPFVRSQVLEIIECVLLTRDGNPVELPSNIDAVVSALNLYRFLLIRESSGHTNYTDVLSSDKVVKGRIYWLLQTREHALRVKSLLEEADSDTSADVLLGMDCLLSVLYRCLEIIEEL